MKNNIILILLHSVLLVHGAKLLNEVMQVCKLTAYPPHPSSGCCGVDVTIDNRIVGGEPTDIRQYPWLAQIHYLNKETRRIDMLCGGFLISGRYVVSAAHCFDTKSKYRPLYVKLGDYNAANNGPDCVNANGQKDCIKSAISVPIEKVIIHSLYNDNHKHYDIAMLKLKNIVTFTETIRPLCLARSDITEDPKNENLTLYSAGWGVVNQMLNKDGEYDDIQSPIKMHVDLPLRNITDCSKPWRKLKRNIQICAGGETGKDVCMGDSGGPLMHDNAGVYEAVGIVSYGAAAPCGAEKSPGVYTKVSSQWYWIMKNIRKYDF